MIAPHSPPRAAVPLTILAAALAWLALTAFHPTPAPAAPPQAEGFSPGSPPESPPESPLGSHPGLSHAPDIPSPQAHADFAAALDLSAFRKLAVFDEGRAKIIDALAREKLERIHGRSAWRDPDTSVKHDPVFTYLDLILDPAYYLDKPLIHVEVLQLRQSMLAGLAPEDQEWWLRQGRLSPHILMSPTAQQAMAAVNADIRLQQALRPVLDGAALFQNLSRTLVLVSPPGSPAPQAQGLIPGSAEHWSHVEHLTDITDATAHPIADPKIAKVVVDNLDRLITAWHQLDAPAANAALAALSANLPLLNPSTYPSKTVRELEHLYVVTKRFTIGYVGYFLAAVALLIALGVQRRWLIAAGIGFLFVGFAIHSAGMAVRIVLSGRWPIHNQFESFMALAWFAVVVGIVLMLVKRQWLFGAAAAALGAVALLFANTVAIPSSDPGPVAGILATSRILYIHVNTVIFAYALIALGFFVSLFYLGAHYFRKPEETPGRLLHDLDQAQMVVLQLAFWLLGLGILLGAYWADHAWGRWWGWDPKETWALITWIIYLIVIHVRLGVKNRGLVTAWLSVLGFFVMLWTHWGVNLLLAGLHSYA
jgi:cytochrome c-type biogenesis protein CcsB